MTQSRLPALSLSAAFVVAASILSACSTPAPTQFHSLMTPPATVDSTAAASAQPPLLYDFGVVTIPPQVSQPQFVIRNPDNSLTLLEQQRWVAPLADELRGALAERLGRRFHAQLARQPLPGMRATERLSVDVLRFEAMPGLEVRIEAAWSVKTLADPPVGVTCRSEIRQSVGTGYEAITAGYRAAVTVLADDIGEVMQGLRSSGQATCR